MKIINKNAIESIGHLLATYDSDLNYISKFCLFKNGEIAEDEYIQNKKGYFQKFLNEYKIARNVKKERVKELLVYTKEWVLGANSFDVDSFAKKLKSMKITQDGKTMTSLASKLLFLSQPEVIIPVDTLNKKALGVKTSSYSEFQNNINKYIKENEKDIINYLSMVHHFLIEIENNYSATNINFKKYRTNRFADKLLWAKGRN